MYVRDACRYVCVRVFYSYPNIHYCMVMLHTDDDDAAAADIQETKRSKPEAPTPLAPKAKAIGVKNPLEASLSSSRRFRERRVCDQC